MTIRPRWYSTDIAEHIRGMVDLPLSDEFWIEVGEGGAVVTITWDTLPGEAATYLSDAETVLDTITTRLDDASNANTGEHYDLADLHADLNNLRDMTEDALRAVERVL